MDTSRPKTRIQQKNIRAIMDAALDVFSTYGFRGSTLDQVAQAAGLSKPNLLYYFPSKEAIHIELLSGLMDAWLAPLREMNPDGDPRTELLGYIQRKIEMSRTMPRESRLFANEILQGAPRMQDNINEVLKPLVDEKVEVIQAWIDQGKIADVHPHHLIFSIWALTQHYADFEVQVRLLLADKNEDAFPAAEEYLMHLFDKILAG